ncbi:transcriptional regulator CitB [Vibrio cholerae]|nr:transcriptional regulator CitB [Vibrio cholerae]
MMELIDVLIVEDETSIADVHSFYLKQTARFRPVGVAQSINEARNMVRILKPKLIFLDNYLPDGRGIEFFERANPSTTSAGCHFYHRRFGYGDRARSRTLRGF